MAAGTAKRDVSFYELECARSHRGPTTATLTHLSHMGPSQPDNSISYPGAPPEKRASWSCLPDPWYKTRADQAPGVSLRAPKRLSWGRGPGNCERVTEGMGTGQKRTKPIETRVLLLVHVM